MNTQGGTVGSKAVKEPGRPVSVAIVDGDNFFRRKIESWLRQTRRFVCIGSHDDGETALADLRSKTPDLAIVDIRLPGIKSDAFVRRLKVHFPSTRILVIAGIPDDEVVLDALAAGADGFLEKDSLTRRGLFSELDRLMAGKHPLPERVRDLLVAEYAKARPKPDIMALLTPREQEVAERKCRGLASETIARELGVSIWTVRTHERDINRKLHVHNRAELQSKLYGVRRP